MFTASNVYICSYDIEQHVFRYAGTSCKEVQYMHQESWKHGLHEVFRGIQFCWSLSAAINAVATDQLALISNHL